MFPLCFHRFGKWPDLATALTDLKVYLPRAREVETMMYVNDTHRLMDGGGVERRVVSQRLTFTTSSSKQTKANIGMKM